MAEKFGLEKSATLDDIYQYIAHNEKKMILPIDEVDELIEAEIKKEYETFKVLNLKLIPQCMNLYFLLKLHIRINNF